MSSVIAYSEANPRLASATSFTDEGGDLAAQRLKDERWRYQSPSRVARFYGGLGWKNTDAEVHLVGGLSSQNFPIWSVDGRASVRF
jgi:hypothetical protein